MAWVIKTQKERYVLTVFNKSDSARRSNDTAAILETFPINQFGVCQYKIYGLWIADCGLRSADCVYLNGRGTKYKTRAMTKSYDLKKLS